MFFLWVFFLAYCWTALTGLMGICYMALNYLYECMTLDTLPPYIAAPAAVIVGLLIAAAVVPKYMDGEPKPIEDKKL
jgi:hypothetical protein